jgi:hypothetical protein
MSPANLFPTPALDVVGVYDGYSQVMRSARPVKAGVKEESKLMEHPLESGAAVTDHKVTQPVEIELMSTLLPADYLSAFQEIRLLFLTGAPLTVRTKAFAYKNMVIAGMPHEENPEVYDSITMTIKLKEVLRVTAKFEAVFQAQNAPQGSTADRGEIQAEEHPASKLYEIFGKK